MPPTTCFRVPSSLRFYPRVVSAIAAAAAADVALSAPELSASAPQLLQLFQATAAEPYVVASLAAAVASVAAP